MNFNKLNRIIMEARVEKRDKSEDSRQDTLDPNIIARTPDKLYRLTVINGKIYSPPNDDSGSAVEGGVTGLFRGNSTVVIRSDNHPVKGRKGGHWEFSSGDAVIPMKNLNKRLPVNPVLVKLEFSMRPYNTKAEWVHSVARAKPKEENLGGEDPPPGGGEKESKGKLPPNIVVYGKDSISIIAPRNPKEVLRLYASDPKDPTKLVRNIEQINKFFAERTLQMDTDAQTKIGTEIWKQAVDGDTSNTFTESITIDPTKQQKLSDVITILSIQNTIQKTAAVIKKLIYLDKMPVTTLDFSKCISEEEAKKEKIGIGAEGLRVILKAMKTGLTSYQFIMSFADMGRSYKYYQAKPIVISVLSPNASDQAAIDKEVADMVKQPKTSPNYSGMVYDTKLELQKAEDAKSVATVKSIFNENNINVSADNIMSLLWAVPDPNKQVKDILANKDKGAIKQMIQGSSNPPVIDDILKKYLAIWNATIARNQLQKRMSAEIAKPEQGYTSFKDFAKDWSHKLLSGK